MTRILSSIVESNKYNCWIDNLRKLIYIDHQNSKFLIQSILFSVAYFIIIFLSHKPYKLLERIQLLNRTGEANLSFYVQTPWVI